MFKRCCDSRMKLRGAAARLAARCPRVSIAALRAGDEFIRRTSARGTASSRRRIEPIIEVTTGPLETIFREWIFLGSQRPPTIIRDSACQKKPRLANWRFPFGKDALMLVLSRQLGEAVFIGDDTVVRVLQVNATQVKLGVEAPKDTLVLRQELTDRVRPRRDEG